MPMRKIYLLFLIITLATVSCQYKKNHVAAKRISVKDSIEIDNIISKNYDYYYNNIDSLPVKAKRLQQLANHYKNDTLAFYSNLFNANYLYQAGDYVNGMVIALKTLDQAEKLKIKKRLPEIYGLIGSLDKENINYPMALQAAAKGLDAAMALKDTEKMIALKGLQAMFINGYGARTGDSLLRKKSLIMNLEALKLAEANPKYERMCIRFYDNISGYYLYVNQFDKTIAYGEKGNALAFKYNAQKSLTYSYAWMGMAYYHLNKKQLGLECLNKALLITRQLKDPFRTMEVYESIYKCYVLSGDYKNAFKYYNIHNLLNDSLKLANNNKQLNELQVQYQTVKKDGEINLLTTTSEAKTRKLTIIGVGLGLTVILLALIFVQYLTISQKNKQMALTNKTIQEQADKLQVLMKELHHRVKNNLQIVSSLLTLQSNRLVDEESRNAIKLGQQRIEAMSLIHRSLYQQENPTLVNMKEYITDLTESIMMSFGVDKGAFNLLLDILVTDLDVDVAMPLGLIINEWVTNAFKHAYKQNKLQPELWIKLSLDKSLQLQIKDNGSGLPAGVWEKPQRSFGIKLVIVLAKQLRGACTVENEGGTILTLNIPKTEIKNLLSA
jgi:two-component sensor histidine kinase/tetratricopeptide (TPR) repeat protein